MIVDQQGEISASSGAARIKVPGIGLEVRDTAVDFARYVERMLGASQESRYSDEQIVRILREADSAPIAEVAKRHGVSDASIYAWRKRFGEIVSDDVKRLQALEAENNRLKKLVAERDLELEVMKEILGKKW
ncbi:transposase [Paraburkholderia rhizosphaerae]|nr:transposase [Paraburkholderia rhizosphaerae]